MLGGVAAADEDEDVRPPLRLDEVTEQHRSLRRIDLDGALHDERLGVAQRGPGVDVDVERVLEDLLGQAAHRGRERRREEQALAALEQGEHARELVGEAERQQAIGLVEHEDLDGREPQRVVVDEIEEAPRRGDDDVGPAAQRHHLRIDRDSADGEARLRRARQMARACGDEVGDLRGQLARGNEHQRAHRSRTRRTTAAALVSCPWARASMWRMGRTNAAVLPEPVCADAHRSRPREDRGDRFALDRRRLREAELGDGANERRGETERRELAHRIQRARDMHRQYHTRIAGRMDIGGERATQEP